MKPVVVQVGALNPQGEATCECLGREYTLPFAIPGERARVFLPKESGSATLLEVIEPDPARIEPSCPHFGKCSRCQWMMATYEAQLSWKEARVLEAFRAAGFEPPPSVRIHGQRSPFGTRTHMWFKVKRVKDRRVILGLPERDSRWLRDISRCPAQLEAFNGLMEPLCEILSREPITVYDEGKDFGKLFGLGLRGDPDSGEVLLIFVTRRTGISKAVATKIADIDKERIVGVLENSHPDPSSMGYGSLTRTVHGRDHFFMKILGRSYKVKGTADAPVSPEMCGEMWNRLDELLPRSFDRAVHGGSGIGLFCLWFAGRSRKVTGIEPSGDADRSARENAVIAGQGNVEFVRGKPEDLLPGSDPPDVLMLSPSRGTLEPSLIRWMTTDRPKRIFLRSSDLRLARDVHALSGAGYEIVSVDAFDFMPHTPRVDLLVTLS